MELRKKPIPPSSPSPPSLPTSNSPPPPSKPPLKRLSKILYLDLDLHHGDGVESAFFTTPQILTLSLHLHAPLFYPSTGSLSDSGPTNPKAPGRGHALNLALESGLGGDALRRVWKVVEEVKESFEPDAVVVQCGVDGLAGDPCKVRTISLSTGRSRVELIRGIENVGMEFISRGFRGMHPVSPRMEYPYTFTRRRWILFTECC